MMSKILTSLLATLLLSSVTLSAYAWDDSWDNSNSSSKSNGYYTTDNSPKSYTLSQSSLCCVGDTLRRPRGTQIETHSNTFGTTESNSQTTSGAYRSGNQVNNSGLIINRE